jgi:selenocysteine lyase/cysteine desulfurase
MLSRRALLAGVGTLSCLQGEVGAPAAIASTGNGITFPDRGGFTLTGTFLNAAYTHPLARRAYEFGVEFLERRWREAAHAWPIDNPRDAAVSAYARLINADPVEIAVVPGTLVGENLIVAALEGLGRKKIVTDALHFYASLAMYAELRRRGVEVVVVPARGGRVEPGELERSIDADTRLVSVSLVSSTTGFQHDLKRLCEIAHVKGALVYADLIQAAGALPIDVRESGVDFCCCGSYKWLMGDAGVAFLYARADRRPLLRRPQVGWREIATESSHGLPFETPGPPEGSWSFRDDAVGLFEVSSPAYASLAMAVGALSYLEQVGVERIAQHRQPLLDRLRRELPRRGFQTLTPLESSAPFVVFAYRNAAARFTAALTRAGVSISVYEHRIRIAPSVYNDEEDIERLLAALA